jgi:hypothetical protein
MSDYYLCMPRTLQSKLFVKKIQVPVACQNPKHGLLEILITASGQPSQAVGPLCCVEVLFNTIGKRPRVWQQVWSSF